jgi:hypothetical protein
MRTKVWRVVVTTLVILSLALNIYLLLLLSKARSGLQEVMTTARNAIAVLSQEPLQIPVMVDEVIPIHASIPISQTVTVPINIDYPLSTIINTSFNIPVLGRQNVSFPIDTLVPVHLSLDIPVQETVVISLSYPLKIELPVTIEIPDDVRSMLDEGLLQIGESFK